MGTFHTPSEPGGDQPTAIKEVNRHQTTGNGKICTIA